MRPIRSIRILPPLLLACGFLAGCDAPSGEQGLRIETVPGPADMVTGGAVLVRIIGATEDALDGVRVTLDGAEVTAAFRPAPPDPLGREMYSWLGLLRGLTTVPSHLMVESADEILQEMSVRNSPTSGPVFSGPHQTPFVCQTEAAGLGPALDAHCTVPTRVSYHYRPTVAPADSTVLQSGFLPYDEDGPRPADIAQVTTPTGETVDYIVRRERGVINRAIYEIAFLHAPGTPLPDPWTLTPGWNRKLVYTFGGGCAAGYRQGSAQNAMSDALLSVGYAVAVSSLNVFGTSCDDVISAETLLMVKEHFVENFGVPVFTIGNGGSGGSMQQHLITQNYPGLLDGLTPSVSFPDGLSVWSSAADCNLIANIVDAEGSTWTEEEKQAVGGFATWQVCGGSWQNSDLERADNCPNAFPDSLAYNPSTNPAGARCSTVDNMANAFGRDESGIALNPFDNEGVQYGLVAYNAGLITAEQFFDLNVRIGGHDRDGNIVPFRSIASRTALFATYATGRINTGGGALGEVPIIDWRAYTDPTADIHDSYRSFVTRARIAAANGGRADNHVILRTAPRDEQIAAGNSGPPPFNAVEVMDRWLTALALDESDRPQVEKVVRSRPADLVDACWTAAGEKIAEPAEYGADNRCNALYPTWGDPRIAAGAPLTDDVLKCQLKLVDSADYARPLTSDQLAQLRGIFPTGVCDYTRPGIDQMVTTELWRRY